MVLPIPHRRSGDAPLLNGSDPSAHPSDFAYRPKKVKDISEQGVAPEIHGFVSNNNMVEPVPYDRVASAYEYNGSDPSAHPSSFIASRPRKDIGEQGVDAEVHGLVSNNNMVLPIPHRRPAAAYEPNGSDPSAQEAPELPGKFKYAQRFAQQKDISPHDVRPDVYVVVSKIINPVPVYRTPVAPVVYFEPWEEIEAKKAKDKADSEADKKAADAKIKNISKLNAIEEDIAEK